MAQYAKIRRKPVRQGCREKTAESGWGGSVRHKSRSWLWLLFGAATAVIVTVVHQSRAGKPIATAAGPPQMVEELHDGLEAAEAVARAFLAEPDPEKRLQWVRNAGDVKTRLPEYPDEARSAAGEIEEVLGHQVDGGRSVTGFVVASPGGNVRLLEVMRTPEGLRVDWDAYARYGTASWQDLFSGRAKQAVVRVFCEPSTERPEPFDDQEKWTCFRLSGPDQPQATLGFARVGHVREAMMKGVVLGTPQYRQRFTLEIVRHQGKSEPLFEITRCLAVGWILGERDVEESWQE